MRKIALVMASLAGIGFAGPGYATDDSAAQGRVQLAQAGVSVSIGDRPAVRSRVVVRDHDRGYHRGWRSHRAQADRVVIVKKRKPAKKTVIIER